MRRIFGRRPDALVGLDIGSACVKLVEISRDEAGGRCRIEACGVEPLPPNAVVDHGINDIEAVAAAIKRLFGSAGARCRDAATAVGGAAVFTKVVEMDASLSDAELGLRVMDEAAQHIPFPLAEVALDFEVQHLSEVNPDQVKVLLAACRGEEIEARQVVLEQSGCRPKVVDIEAHAAQRAFERVRQAALGADGDAPAALIDLGFAATKVSIFAGDKALGTRELAFGARQLADDTQRRHGLSLAEARDAAQGNALPAGYVAEVLAPFGHSLAERVERAFQFCLASSPHAKVEHAFLAGGMATFASLAPSLGRVLGEVLGEALATPTTIANPFFGMNRAEHVDGAQVTELAPALAIACGLALWEGPA